MIRINLLPQKRQAPQEASQAWLGILLAVLFIEGIALVVIHQQKTDELATHARRNNELTSQINEIQRTVANHAAVKEQLSVFRQREEAIGKLQAARSGPTAVLLELARVMTAGRGPTMDADKLAQLRKDNPLAVPNPAWDPRRLWLTSYKEADRTVTIEGMARDGEDVSELARRLTLSNYFSDVKLLPAQKSVDSITKAELVRFQLQARVIY